MSSLKIVNAKILMGEGIVEGAIFAEDGKIAKIGKETKIPAAEERLDAHGKLLLPGIIDAHVHFREPGFEDKEDFYSGSCAAAAGGVTTFIDMPNTKPQTNTFERYREKIKLGESKSIVDFALHFGYPADLSDLNKVVESGCRSVKVYYYDLVSPQDEVKKLFEYVEREKLNIVLVFHAEDKYVIEENEKRIGSTVGKRGIDYHYSLRSKDAEIRAVKEILKMSERHEVSIHFSHISTIESFNMIKEMISEGRDITFEVTPHHLLLNHEDFKHLGPIIKVDPPIRSKKDVTYLIKHIGDIPIIASDHAPHTAIEKLYGLFDITKAPSGIVGVETMLSLLLTIARRIGYPIPSIIKKVSQNPAKRFGLKKGAIIEGYDADFAIIDLKKKWKIKGNRLHGKTKFTPFENFEVLGKVETTIVRGEIVYEDGECVGKKGWGKYVKALQGRFRG